MIRNLLLVITTLLFPIFSAAQSYPAPPMNGPASYRPGPPFSLKAPELTGVRKQDEETSRELLQRYEGAASQSATAWESADAIRRNLGGQGMLLNTDTSVALTRMTLYLQTAAAALQEHDWQYARLSLERAEYMTEKVFRVVGR